MKIDRLLSIIIYLLNHSLVSARELAQRFEVSHRTIQRDMETINASGIPIVSIQGPSGGYSIMDTWKMDRQLLSIDDFFFILTSLKEIGKTLPNQKLENSIEKIMSLSGAYQEKALSKRREKLHVDFSMIGGFKNNRELIALVQDAIENQQLLEFDYTNNKLISNTRIIEPMTLVFKWRGWYLFGFCHLREQYRIFRMSRISNPKIKNEHFKRRDKSYNEFENENMSDNQNKKIDLILKFDPFFKTIVQDFFYQNIREILDTGHFIVEISLPNDNWVIGYLLSYGPYLEVLSPEHIREQLKDFSQKVNNIYS